MDVCLSSLYEWCNVLSKFFNYRLYNNILHLLPIILCYQVFNLLPKAIFFRKTPENQKTRNKCIPLNKKEKKVT